MQNIIIIGTLHAGSTPNEDLEKIFRKYKPTQILVEISQNDINNNISEYPPEMIFTYKWAIENNIKVNGFDSKINVFKEGVTENDNLELIKEQEKLIKNYSWKDFNKSENEKLLDIDEITDHVKEKKREQKMLKNINATIDDDGVILIITGCGHLDFLEQNIKKAIFPFR
jgi:pheromone shutdown protein TraB